MQHYGLGQPMRRLEDQRFLTGQGAYIDDLKKQIDQDIEDARAIFELTNNK